MGIILILQVGLGEHDTPMVNKSVSPTLVESLEIMIVENEDRVVKDLTAMDEVITEVEMKSAQIKVVLSMKGC